MDFFKQFIHNFLFIFVCLTSLCHILRFTYTKEYNPHALFGENAPIGYTNKHLFFFVEFLYFLFYAVAEFQSANVIEDS